MYSLGRSKWGMTMGERNLAENQGTSFGCCCCESGIHRTQLTSRLSRRRFLGTAIAGVAAAITLGTALPKPVRAQTTISPDDALQALLEGNKRFVEKHLTSFDEDLAILRDNTVEKQEPFAAVLSCRFTR